MRPVAIVESDATLCARLREAVEAAGLHAEIFSSPDTALIRLRTARYALAITAANSIGFCREASALVPVIAIGCDCIAALEHGADDCVARMTSPRELAARIQSVLRRAPHAPDLPSISLSEMRVRTGGETHDLSRGEAELLAVLLDHAPTPVPITTLTALLGARRGTVESRIKNVRRKLGPGRLVSRGSLGYQLVEE